MSSAISGEPPTPVSQKYTPTNLLDGWEVDVSCIPGHKARREKLFALIEHIHLMHGKIYQALRNEIKHPSLSSETYCLSVIKIHNELLHLQNVKDTELLLRDRHGYDPEIDAHEVKAWHTSGASPHRLYEYTQPNIDRLQRLGYGSSFDPELKFWLDRTSGYNLYYSVPGILEHSTWKPLNLRDDVLESAREYLNFEMLLPKEVVTGHWYHPSPVDSDSSTWPFNFTVRDLLGRQHEEARKFTIKNLIDVCNSFVVELATIAEASHVSNYATLRRALIDSTWLSPSLNWVHTFLNRTREGLTKRGMALASRILPQTLICRGYYPEGPGSRGLEYYTYRRLLGQTLAGYRLGRLSPTFLSGKLSMPCWACWQTSLTSRSRNSTLRARWMKELWPMT